jgi:hypothetical protein
MNKIFKLLGAINFLIISFSSFAEVALPITLEFNNLGAAYYGKANTSNGCDGFFNCYSESGFIVGTINTPTHPFAHLHKGSLDGDAFLYHADSGGIYLRASDLSAFSLDAFLLKAPFNPSNTYTGKIIIKGFDQALTSPEQTQIALLEVDNGYVGSVVLNDQFRSIKALWIHYENYPLVPPAGVTFDLTIDNVELSAPQIPQDNGCE